MNRKIKFLFLIAILAALSINYAEGIRGLVNDISTAVVKKYVDAKEGMSDIISDHFDQRDEIRILRERNDELEERTLTLDSLAAKLNYLLSESNLTEYTPKTKLVAALSYAHLGDYNKVWLDFADFNTSRIYGLIYQGHSAGIVTVSEGRALALLQYDPKSTFAVYLGSEKIKGIAFGAENSIEVRYIPLWTEPKVDDEVITSGLDNIFFEGVRVGKVTDVHKDESYFTAVVKPYAAISVPDFFHVVLQY